MGLDAATPDAAHRRLLFLLCCAAAFSGHHFRELSGKPGYPGVRSAHETLVAGLELAGSLPAGHPITAAVKWHRPGVDVDY